MFGRSKTPAFKPYALGAKPARRFPRWLAWLLVGGVLGVAIVLFIQNEYLPPRLSAPETRQLTERYNQATLALRQTRAQLEQAQETIASQESQNQALSSQLESARADLQPLEETLAMLKNVLPPDPRGGELQIRAARFYNREGHLDYQVVFTRDAAGKDFSGDVQFAVEGRYPSGRAGNVTLDPITLQLDDFHNLNGALPLPDGMQARQITVRVLDAGNRTQAMRVINARN